jgi:hypothetical protein
VLASRIATLAAEASIGSEGVMEHTTAQPSVSVRGSLVRVCVALLVAGAILVGFAQLLDARQGVSIPSGTTRVDATLSDYRIAVRPRPLSYGRLAFVVHNAGTIPHELVIFRTQSSADSLPLRADGDVNEDSASMTSVLDSGDSLAPNQTKVFVAKLPPGHYVAVCNLSGHYHLGMRLDITVR